MLRGAEQGSTRDETWGVPVVVLVNSFVAFRHLLELVIWATGTELALQVSSMGALVSQVEELVETAEMSCSMMQVCSHWLGFRTAAAARKPASELVNFGKERVSKTLSATSSKLPNQPAHRLNGVSTFAACH